MRANLTTRDYEILSAYIDGQLAPGEQRKLEERLQARPELQVALDELKRTRALLRQAPRRRAPRNFTLTPAMVGEQRRRPAPWAGWFPVLSFTSALAAMALVVLVVLQFAPPGATSQTIAMQQAPVMESVAQNTPEGAAMKKEAPAGAPATTLAQPEDAARPEDAAPAAGEVRQEDTARNMVEATPTAQPVVLPGYEATAQAFGEITPPPAEEPAGAPGADATPDAAAMAAPAPEGTPVASDAGAADAGAADAGAADAGASDAGASAAAATPPPVIHWNNSVPGAPPSGMGGMGGGGGEGPSLGPLMGPPPAPEADAATGMGGGAPDGGAPDGGAVDGSQAPETQAATETQTAGEPEASIPTVAVTPAGEQAPGAEAESAAAPTPAAGTPVAEVPAAPGAASGAGPILGVPEAGAGGQIVEKRAIMGDENAARAAAGDSLPPAGAVEQAPQTAAEQRGPLGISFVALTALQVTLALLAVAAGVAAYLLRLRQNGR